jgi:hypothetical protein
MHNAKLIRSNSRLDTAYAKNCSLDQNKLLVPTVSKMHHVLLKLISFT